jgi:hypothetical protein
MNTFHDIAPTAVGHFTVLMHTAALHLVRFIEDHVWEAGSPSVIDRYPFLRDFVAQVAERTPSAMAWDEATHRWVDAVTSWESLLDDGLPFRRLQRHFEMTLAERVAVMLIGLVEEDGRFGALYADLQTPVASRRPTTHLIAGIVVANGLTDDGAGVVSALAERGIVQVLHDSAPLADRGLRVPEQIWTVLRGTTRPAKPPISVEDIVLPQEVRNRLERAAALLAEGAVRRVVVRGSSGSDRDLAARSIVSAAGLSPMAMALPIEPAELRTASLAAIASGSALVCSHDLTPGQTGAIPEVGSAPLVIVTGLTGGFPVDPAQPSITIEIPPLDLALRRCRWALALNGVPLAEPEEVAHDFLLPGAIIEGIATAASLEAELRGETAISTVLVRSELQRESDRRLETLAVRVDPAGPDERLIIGDRTAALLDDLVLRCRHREDLAGELAASSAAAGHGVRALFTGASGTGKTLAARVIARRLGLDVYRVDLAAIFDKYVGETEKNLHQVLEQAEQLNVVLLLDEGDSLLGSRTELRSANDRYANLETNFLLQRLEDYGGIVFITTNEAEHIDHAFARRMDATIAFNRPGPAERLAIWQLHLPANHDVDSTELAVIAREHALTGGQIRNAAQHTVLVALSEGGAAPARRHVAAAIANEYQKSGAMHPDTIRGSVSASQRLARLMDATP